MSKFVFALLVSVLTSSAFAHPVQQQLFEDDGFLSQDQRIIDKYSVKEHLTAKERREFDAAWGRELNKKLFTIHIEKMRDPMEVASGKHQMIVNKSFFQASPHGEYYSEFRTKKTSGLVLFRSNLNLEIVAARFSVQMAKGDKDGIYVEMRDKYFADLNHQAEKLSVSFYSATPEEKPLITKKINLINRFLAENQYGSVGSKVLNVGAKSAN